MPRITPAQGAAVVVLAAAGALAWLATRKAGPLPKVPPPLTELQAPARSIQAHLVSLGEHLTEPVFTPHRFPDRTAPGITETIHYGFTPKYAIADPQVAALPAEAVW